jgi:glycosyltransferase involved in cell wall biosynthesis
MKIAHIIQQLVGGGGLQVCVHNICNRHVKAGDEVYVFCCDAQKQTIKTDYKVRSFLRFRGINQFYPISKYFITSYVKRLQKKYNFDLWQIDGGYPYGAFLIDYFRKYKIPCILRCCGDDIQINEELDYGIRRNKRVNEIISKNYYRYPAAVAITETVKEEYLKLKMPEESIHLIPNGVDIARLKGNPTQNIREKHNIPSDSTIILSVGRNHPKKGYSLIPRILEIVLNKGVDAYWIIIGRGCSDIKNEDKFESLKNKIILIEEIVATNNSYEIPPDNLVDYYKGADLFAMTSLLETFGIVLVEALGAGLPVVCFNAPGVKNVMRSEYGSICPMHDTKSFADSIMEIACTKEYESLSKQCRIYAEKFSWDIIADKYTKLYLTLLEKMN